MRTSRVRRRVVAPGQGENARTCRSISTAGCVQSIHPCDLRSRGARVASDASCGRGAMSPDSQAGIVSSSSDAPSAASRSLRLPASSSGRIASARDARMSPVSSPASTRMIVAPVSASPARIAAATGDAPRQRGSSEACTFSVPKRGRASTPGRRICPYATITCKSGAYAASADVAAGSRSRAGCSTSIPAACAATFTGGGRVDRPRPPGRSGCVTTTHGR